MEQSNALLKPRTAPTRRLYVRKSPRRRLYHSLERGFHFAEFIRGDDSINYIDLWGLSAGDVKTTTVTANGAGNGLFASFIVGEAGGQTNKSWYTMNYTVEETGEKFSAKYTDTSLEGSGFKLGVGAYTLTIEDTGKFNGEPTREEIIRSFAGDVTTVGFSASYFGFYSFETENWVVTTGTFGVSAGLPVSGGFEEFETRLR